MKRSEAIKHIRDVLIDLYRLPYDYAKDTNAHILLNEIEALGMLPPKWYDKYGAYEMYRHTWEAEDE